jgi:putative transcriptional regulator
MATTTRKSRILGEMHDTALGLHKAGLINKRRMREFDALCHLDVDEMPPQKIKSLREKAHVSQAVFAAVLNTSLSTVQKWEIGDKKPSGPSLKLLNLVERKGLEAVL